MKSNVLSSDAVNHQQSCKNTFGSCSAIFSETHQVCLVAIIGHFALFSIPWASQCALLPYTKTKLQIIETTACSIAKQKTLDQ